MQLQQRLSEFRAAGATVWAISVDDAAASRTLAADLHVTFPIGTDTDLRAARAFGVSMAGRAIALPATFVIAPDGSAGRIAYRHVGETAPDRPALEAVLEAVRAAVRDR